VVVALRTAWRVEPTAGSRGSYRVVSRRSLWLGSLASRSDGSAGSRPAAGATANIRASRGHDPKPRGADMFTHTRYIGIIREPVIRTFTDRGTEDLFNGRNSKAARQQLPQSLWTRARRLLDQLQRAHVVGDMVQPPGNRFERLRDGRYSVRVTDQYRVTFRWKEGAAEEVWCGDYHD